MFDISSLGRWTGIEVPKGTTILDVCCKEACIATMCLYQQACMQAPTPVPTPVPSPVPTPTQIKKIKAGKAGKTGKASTKKEGKKTKKGKSNDCESNTKKKACA